MNGWFSPTFELEFVHLSHHPLLFEKVKIASTLLVFLWDILVTIDILLCKRGVIYLCHKIKISSSCIVFLLDLSLNINFIIQWYLHFLYNCRSTFTCIIVSDRNDGVSTIILFFIAKIDEKLILLKH